MLIYRFIGLLAQAGADLSVYRFIGLLAQAGADLSVYRFIGLSAQAGADLSVYRFIGAGRCRFVRLSVYRRRPVPICPFIGLSAQAGKNRPCHHAGNIYIIYNILYPYAIGMMSVFSQTLAVQKTPLSTVTLEPSWNFEA